MKIFNPYQNLFLATTFFLVLLLTVPLKAQDSRRDFLAAHNRARAEVGVGPLIWDETVAAYARDYANERKGRGCGMEHSSGPYGENIAWSSGNMAGVDAVKMWVDEQFDYDYDSNSCLGEQCLHYTQVVWRNTERLGCAKVRCNNGHTFITCNYDPPGNWVGEWPY